MADTVHTPLLPLTATGLRLRRGGTQVINGVDLSIPAVGITMICGPNGAGKSLLLRLLHGLIPQDAGDILWHGAPPTLAHRHRQAMVFQRPVVLRRSVRANMDFALNVRGKPNPQLRDHALADVGLAGMHDRPARALSGGEQQRLALARALVTQPDVLFLDEATASLDPPSIQVIEAVLMRAASDGTKVIFVSHDLGQIQRLADDVVFMHQGRVLEHTPADQFLAEPQSHHARDFMAGKLVL